MSFVEDNSAFEAWLRKQCDVVEADLDRKHDRMRESAFNFLRATYFRWARTIEKICPDLDSAPHVLAVGDLHVENFGTWRDAEGRLIWGVNDFDEAAVMPYASDLVRLAASVRLTPDLSLSPRRASEAIQRGYERGLDNPRPTLLDEQATWLRKYVACSDCDRARFWDDIEALPRDTPPQPAFDALTSDLPDGAEVKYFAPRTKGGGSLGRPRFIVVAKWRGGHIVREAKALVSSAWNWAHHKPADHSNFLDLATGHHRAPDPFLKIRGNAFIVRRIAADSRKIDLGADAGAELDERVLMAMGVDLAAIHAARHHDARKISQDLEGRPDGWLNANAKRAAQAVTDDHREYVAHTRRGAGKQP